jgi:hypothetical protein
MNEEDIEVDFNECCEEKSPEEILKELKIIIFEIDLHMIYT